MFSIDYSHKVRRFLKKCDKDLGKRIVNKIELLKTVPVPHKAVSVVGEDRTFRIRIGDYRVLYEVKWDKNIILIAKVDKRSKVY